MNGTATRNVSGCSCCYRKPEYLSSVFYLTSVFGGTVATISIVQHLILLRVFSARRHFRRSLFLYFAVLAVADLILSICYILLFSVSYVYEIMESKWLMNRWYEYVLLLTGFSHVVLCVAPYLLVAASVERYLVSHHHVTYSSLHRILAIFAVLAFSIFSKATVYWELEVKSNNACEVMGSKYIYPTQLAQNEVYARIWVFWYRNVATVFVPFFLLLFLNLLLLKDYGWFRFHSFASHLPQFYRRPVQPLALHSTSEDRTGTFEEVHYGLGFDRETPAHYNPTSSNGTASFAERARNKRIENILMKTCIWARRAKARVRKATTRTLIAIIAEYLICHSLAFMVTAWEHVDRASMHQGKYRNFFVYASEVINLMTLIACCIRLPTYLFCDVTFRREVYWIICGNNLKLSTAYFKIFSMKKYDNSGRQKNGLGSGNLGNGIQKSINGTTSKKYAPKTSASTAKLGFVVLELLETKSQPYSSLAKSNNF